jgi:hypothetical protein
MALTLIEGFDHVDLATMRQKGWNLSTTSAGELIVSGRITGNGYWLRQFPTTQLYKAFPAAQTTTIAGFAIKIPHLPLATTAVFIIGGGGYVGFNTAGRLVLFNVSGTAVATGTTAVTAGSWNFVEVKLVCGGSSGTGTVHLNGAAEIAATTGNFGSSHTDVELQYEYGASDPWTEATPANGLSWDDVYVCDASGSLNNDFLGDSHVETIYPAGDGYHHDWTPSSGTSHYALVDEEPPDGDTTYNYTQTVGAIDTYTMNDLLVSIGPIYGVQVVADLRKDDAGFRQAATVLRRASTDYVGATRTLNTTYQPYTDLYNVDPSTSAAWDIPGVNAAEFGVKEIA